MASAAEEEDAERGDQTHSLEGGDDFEKDIIYKPEVQIEPLLPPQSGGALQLPPPRTAAAPAPALAVAPLLVQPLEEERETRSRTRFFLHLSLGRRRLFTRRVWVFLFVFQGY